MAPVFVTSTFSLGTVNILVSLEPFLPLYFSCGSENSAQAESNRMYHIIAAFIFISLYIWVIILYQVNLIKIK